MSIKAVSIGCGKRGRLHAQMLEKIPGVTLVAAADPVEQVRREFLADRPHCVGYDDVPTMLQEHKPDLAIICTRPQVRLEPIRQCAQAGVRGIQSEKPVAMSWNEALEIKKLAEQTGALVAFTHQRRFEAQFVRARRELAEGRIGQLLEVHGRCPNFYDWGTHWMDMFHHLQGDQVRAQWVLAQADFSEINAWFEVKFEKRGVVIISFDNHVRGVLITEYGKDMLNIIRLIGSEGVIEVKEGQQNYRLLTPRQSTDWQDATQDPQGAACGHNDGIRASLQHLIDCMKTGQRPGHGIDNAIKATELIFAAYASRVSRGRIDLPLVPDPALHMDRIFDESQR